MKCPRCHSDNPDRSRFCGSCAALLAGEGPYPDSLTKTLATPLPVISKDKLIAGKYRIMEEIGHGGMGVVYKAEDVKLKRFVALKFLPPHLMDSPELKERFLVEAQAAAALNHPNICTIYEVGESEDRPYIAMELVEGETLRDKLRRGPLKAGDALDLAIQVAAGLGEAHRKGIVHRDLKSANIMVTARGQAKVMDFGLAKLRGGSSLTKSQTTIGTVAYMSPEQARGQDLDPRTDIWSLGVVLYELLAGKLPFRGDNDQTVIHSILHREPESLIKVRPGLAPELDHVVGQALSKKPAGIGQRTRPERRHKHRRFSFLSRLPIGVGDAHPGVIDEHLLARLVRHPQHRRQGFRPLPVSLAELRVVISSGSRLPILFPQKLSRDALLSKLPVDLAPVRFRLLADQNRLTREKPLLELLLRKTFG